MKSTIRRNTLSISCVTFDTEPLVLERTLSTLKRSVEFAIQKNVIEEAELHLINNNTHDKEFITLAEKQRKIFTHFFMYTGHGNIGYGKGNNLAIINSTCEYHLIINPDVDTDEQAIALGILHLQANSSVGVVTPNATNATGETEYLAKRDPSILIIFLRSFSNRYLTQLFQTQLDRYIYKQCLPLEGTLEIDLASGCFMLCRMAILKQVHGFSNNYFLYFEDFDLSRRIRRVAKIIYLPIMRIRHYGGYTAKKGFNHKYHFLRSAFRYFFIDPH